MAIKDPRWDVSSKPIDVIDKALMSGMVLMALKAILRDQRCGEQLELLLKERHLETTLILQFTSPEGDIYRWPSDTPASCFDIELEDCRLLADVAHIVHVTDA